MTLGVGGSTIEEELSRMTSMREGRSPIDDGLRARVAKAQASMRAEGIEALYLDPSTSCFYFTGLRFKLTERLHGVCKVHDG
jgi:Xaa-Pro dipeptidase